MTTPHDTRGRLIAVDGWTGPAIATAARRLVRALGPSGLSAWDASGIFTEVTAATDAPPPSSRTVTLLYAADLAFRIRWQITPALEAGMWVVAAPYIETAVALGVASGLPRKWLIELFEFAPKPNASFRANDRAARANGRARDGYPEFFWDTLRAHGDDASVKRLADRAMEYLATLERRGRCDRLTEAAVEKLRSQRRL